MSQKSSRLWSQLALAKSKDVLLAKAGSGGQSVRQLTHNPFQDLRRVDLRISLRRGSQPTRSFKLAVARDRQRSRDEDVSKHLECEHREFGVQTMGYQTTRYHNAAGQEKKRGEELIKETRVGLSGRTRFMSRGLATTVTP